MLSATHFIHGVHIGLRVTPSDLQVEHASRQHTAETELSESDHSIKYGKQAFMEFVYSYLASDRKDKPSPHNDVHIQIGSEDSGGDLALAGAEESDDSGSQFDPDAADDEDEPDEDELLDEELSTLR